MRVPDRPWGDADAGSADRPRDGWDHQARSDGLAERLTRLMPGHPSADLRADNHWRDWDLDDAESGAEDFSPEDWTREDEGPDGLPPDEPEPGDTTAGGSSGGDVTGRAYARHSADAPWADKEQTPYRPWFSADGAGDPWFAAPTDWASRG